MSRRKEVTHCVPGGAGFRCLHCGEESNGGVAYPAPVNVWMAAVKTFTAGHRDCQPSERGAARFKYSTPAEWRSSWDTGVSSLTIYSVFAGGTLPDGAPGVPHDPADFGRCHRLLKVAPTWRDNLHRVAERFPAWRPLVDRWADLERLYEEELPTGKAPKLYALMQELLAKAGA